MNKMLGVITVPPSLSPSTELTPDIILNLNLIYTISQYNSGGLSVRIGINAASLNENSWVLTPGSSSPPLFAINLAGTTGCVYRTEMFVQRNKLSHLWMEVAPRWCNCYCSPYRPESPWFDSAMG